MAMNAAKLELRVRAVATDDTEVAVLLWDGETIPVHDTTLVWRDDHYTLVIRPERPVKLWAERSAPKTGSANWMVLPEELARLQRAESQLKLLTPRVGSIWHWEPMSSTASQRLIVTNVKVNADGEVWIESGHPYRLGREVRGEKMWNTLSRWMEAAVLVEPAEDGE